MNELNIFLCLSVLLIQSKKKLIVFFLNNI